MDAHNLPEWADVLGIAAVVGIISPRGGWFVVFVMILISYMTVK